MKYLYVLLSVLLIACSENVNDWEVDESLSRLFRTTSFTVGDVKPTTVELRYKGVMDATKFIVEFSEGDSLQFAAINRTDELLADTLTPYSEGSTAVDTEYRTVFENLKGTTRYSVRMKAVNASLESGYMQATFVTPDEQIFTGSTASTSRAILYWTPGMEVTHITYTASGGAATDYQITAQQKAAGKAVITGLTAGTSYSAQIFNSDARRGQTTFRTIGLRPSEGASINVQPSEAKTVGTILTNCVAEGKSVVALIFESAQVYEIEQFTIPAGISTLYIVGDATAEDVQPELYLHRVTMSAPFDVLRFQNVDLNARLNSSNYFFDIGTVNCFKTVDFDGCTIRNIGRCLVRPNHADLDIETIRINNCIIKSVGVSGYGLIVYGREIANVSLISLTNSTIMEIGSDRLMQLKGATKQIVIDRCILCNFTSGSAEVLRIDTKPGSITWTNSIFCGTNNGAKLNAGRGDYSAYLEYYNCYVTSDLTMNTYKFTNATTLEMTSEQMFVDPRGGDFHLREGVRFDGEGTAGDPRWW